MSKIYDVTSKTAKEVRDIAKEEGYSGECTIIAGNSEEETIATVMGSEDKLIELITSIGKQHEIVKSSIIKAATMLLLEDLTEPLN